MPKPKRGEGERAAALDQNNSCAREKRDGAGSTALRLWAIIPAKT
jgi:hypothetical protein